MRVAVSIALALLGCQASRGSGEDASARRPVASPRAADASVPRARLPAAHGGEDAEVADDRAPVGREAWRPLPLLPPAGALGGPDGGPAAALGAAWRPVRAGPGRAVLRPLQAELSLEVDTRGAAATPLTVIGVRTTRPLDLSGVRWTLDWNAQVNGAYLKASLYLAPQASEGDPEALPDFVRVQHVGVPPGDRWRHEVAAREAGRLRFLDRAGWPADRRGRAPGRIRAQIALQDGRLVYREGDAVLSTVEAPAWPRVHVYLTLAGHSNYPARAVRVGAVEVRTR
jgi:hypothetical protein